MPCPAMRLSHRNVEHVPVSGQSDSPRQTTFYDTCLCCLLIAVFVSNTRKPGFDIQPLIRAGTSTLVNLFVANLMSCDIWNKDIASSHVYSRSKIAFIVSYTFFHGLWFATPSNLRRQYRRFPHHDFSTLTYSLRLRGVQNCAKYWEI